tara:strand:+ start:317 stop:955 length:639 start_codon:yes stop_codon:yes gene_type:complete
MKKTLLIFGTNNFNNSLKEIKDYLDFSLVFFDNFDFSESSLLTINFVLVDSDVCNRKDVHDLICKIKDKPLLLLEKQKFSQKINTFDFTEKITLPLSIPEMTIKIMNLIISATFNKNSTIKINNYIIDKNERKLIKKNIFITITEREAQLIELLAQKSEPLSKKKILKEIWNYSEHADTHTVETHIYRLRKKILNKFKDDNFIVNSKNGYSI